MTTYRTNNPVGSTDPRDLYDNAQNIDEWANSTEKMTHDDRLGVSRKTLHGMQREFEQFLGASGYVFLDVEYAAGIEFTSYSQVIAAGGEFWRLSASAELPYVTTGAGMPEEGMFVSVGDASLRQDLMAQGSTLLGRGVVAVDSIADLLSLADRRSDLRYMVRGYHSGSSIGGGEFYWDAERSKSQHNGGTVISPTVPWDGLFSTHPAFLLGTGETATAGSGCWVRVYEHDIQVTWFGSISNDPTKDNKDVLEAVKRAIIAKSSPRMPAYVLPRGELYYSVSPNFGEVNGFRIIGPGADGCRLKYTGNDKAFRFDLAPSSIGFRYGASCEGFLVDAGPSGTAGIFMENLAHCTFKEVYAINGAASCILFDIRLGVLINFDTCGVTVNRWPVSSVHQESLRLAASSSQLQNTTACTFVNCLWEGASLAGVRLLDADVNTFVGGTAEANSGRGVLIGSNSSGNSFKNFALEANAVVDVRDDGRLTQWEGGYSISSGGFQTGSSSRLCRLASMLANKIEIETGAIGVQLENVCFNRDGNGSFTDNGADTAITNLFNLTTGAFEQLTKPLAGITVTASPFTYTNNTRRYQNVLINAGTVTQLLYSRNGSTTLLRASSGSVVVAPGDALVVSYDVAPNMSRAPFGNLTV